MVAGPTVDWVKTEGCSMIDAAILNQYYPNRPEGYFDAAAVGAVPSAVTEAVGGGAPPHEGGLCG